MFLPAREKKNVRQQSYVGFISSRKVLVPLTFNFTLKPANFAELNGTKPKAKLINKSLNSTRNLPQVRRGATTTTGGAMSVAAQLTITSTSSSSSQFVYLRVCQRRTMTTVVVVVPLTITEGYNIETVQLDCLRGTFVCWNY